MARRPVTEPRVRFCSWPDSHRLISSRFSEGGTVLAAVADNARELADLVLLDCATNDRVNSEQQGGVGISMYELLYGVPNAHIVNAAFAHAGESGARFSDKTRGAWYAADSQKASVAEVVYHKGRRLAEIVDPDGPNQRPRGDVSTFDDWMADFKAEFHVLDPPEEFQEFLQPEPVPKCYAASQELGRRLLNEGSNGIFYPSVRYPGASCTVCFRPALVYNPHRSQRLEITLTANEAGYDHVVRKVPIRAS